MFSALLDGFERQAGIIAFLLIMGGAFQIMNSSRAIDAGIFSFLGFTKGLERYRFIKMLGVNNVVISLIIILFSLFGAVFGMSEETLAFVIIIVPLAISMGYDSITGPVSYTHLRAHETRHDLVCRLLLEKKKKISYTHLRAHETGRNIACRLLLEKKKKARRNKKGGAQLREC